MSAAAAASFAVGFILLWPVRPNQTDIGVHEAMISDKGTGARDDGDPIPSLVSRSQHLEAVLQRLPPRPAVERAATSATIDDLQTRIQMLDQRLSASAKDDLDQTRRLWSARVELMNSLVYVRYAEAARNGDPSDNASVSGAI
jgi:hypothetical protein